MRGGDRIGPSACTVLLCTVFSFTILHCIVLYYIVFYCTALYKKHCFQRSRRAPKIDPDSRLEGGIDCVSYNV